MRTLLIAGNWKLNPLTTEASMALAEGVKTGLGPATDVHVAICPPFVFLGRIDQVLEGSPIGLGAQDMFWESAGAFTGEISGPMLVDIGCTHVILGHSERRHGLGETNGDVNKKLKAALESRLIPIVCVGELKEERLGGKTQARVPSIPGWGGRARTGYGVGPGPSTPMSWPPLSKTCPRGVANPAGT